MVHHFSYDWHPKVLCSKFLFFLHWYNFSSHHSPFVIVLYQLRSSFGFSSYYISYFFISVLSVYWLYFLVLSWIIFKVSTYSHKTFYDDCYCYCSRHFTVIVVIPAIFCFFRSFDMLYSHCITCSVSFFLLFTQATHILLSPYFPLKLSFKSTMFSLIHTYYVYT